MKQVRATAVVLVLVAAIVFGFVQLIREDGATAKPRLAKGLAAVTISTSTKVRLSPDASLVAVVEGGQVSVIGVQDAKVVTRAGRNVVDAAWMPDGTRLIVTEGPTPTGEIAAVDLTGEVAGVAKLKPSVGFGNGRGIGIDERGTRAAVIVVTRDAIGGTERSDLAVVDFATGAVRVYPTPNRSEARPVFLDADTVAVATKGPTTPARLAVVDLASGRETIGRVIFDGPYARTAAGDAVVSRRAAQGAIRLLAIETVAGGERDLFVTKPHRRVVDVDLQLTRALVRVPDGRGGGHLAFEPFAS